MSRRVAIIGSTSSHGGSMVTASSTFKTHNGYACVEGDIHSCPIPGHGDTPVTGNLSNKSTIHGKHIVLDGSVANCGAVINGSFATKVTLT